MGLETIVTDIVTKLYDLSKRVRRLETMSVLPKKYAQVLFYFPAGDGVIGESPYKVDMWLPVTNGVLTEVRVRCNTAPTTNELRVIVNNNGANVIAGIGYVWLPIGNFCSNSVQFTNDVLIKNEVISAEILQIDAVTADIVVAVRYTYL
jgi:hypothetical protein